MTYHTMMYASYGGSVLYYYISYHLTPSVKFTYEYYYIPFKIGLRPPDYYDEPELPPPPLASLLLLPLLFPLCFTLLCFHILKLPS